MLTLYTAVGQLIFEKAENGTDMPLVINGTRKYGMCKNELILWSCLAFQIMHYHELESAYEARLPKDSAEEELPLSHYLNRLLFRGLVVKGEAVTAIDALYRLFGNLQILPISITLGTRIHVCIRLFLKGKLKLKDIRKVFRKKQYGSTEKAVLNLARSVQLTSAELITCIDRDISKPDALYEDTERTSEALAEDVRMNHTQYPVLQAIGSLYLDKQICFMKT